RRAHQANRWRIRLAASEKRHQFDTEPGEIAIRWRIRLRTSQKRHQYVASSRPDGATCPLIGEGSAASLLHVGDRSARPTSLAPDKGAHPRKAQESPKTFPVLTPERQQRGIGSAGRRLAPV